MKVGTVALNIPETKLRPKALKVKERKLLVYTAYNSAEEVNYGAVFGSEVNRRATPVTCCLGYTSYMLPECVDMDMCSIWRN